MKKYLLSLAVLAMSMASITSCSKDDEKPLPGITIELSTEQLTVKAGEPLLIQPKYSDVSPTTTYEWTIDGEVVSTLPAIEYTTNALGSHTITLKVTNEGGTVSKSFNFNIIENLATVTFEGASWTALIDNPQYGGSLLYGDNAVNYAWRDNETGLSGSLTLAWGGAYGFAEGGTAISNYIDADIQSHATYEYQLAVPASNGSQNFAVAYCDATIKFAEGVKHTIKTMDIGPTTYELGVVLNGDGYAVSLAESGNFTITVTADNGKTLDIDMARDGNVLRTWKTFDFSSLGAVNSLSFSMNGSDSSDFGPKHPKYFAFDNVVVTMVEAQ